VGRDITVRARKRTEPKLRLDTQAWRTLKRKHKAHSKFHNLPCWLAEYGMCLLDGIPIDYVHNGIDASYETDHKQPRSVRPDLMYIWSNLRASHRKCNRSRQAKPVAEQHIWVRPTF
jgi:hypothetical protein